MANFINGTDYNVSYRTPRYTMRPLTTERDLPDMQRLCTTSGFDYPYIHKNLQTIHLPLQERIQKYTELGDKAASGAFGRTWIQSIRSHNSDYLLGITYFGEVGQDDPLFRDVKPQEAFEIGYFTDKLYQGKGIASECIYYTAHHAIENGLPVKELHASIDPAREASIAIAKKMGLELVQHIPGGDARVKYLDDNNQPASRNIYRTPENWKLPLLY